MSFKHDALEVLTFHRYSPESFMRWLHHQPDKRVTLKDENKQEWQFVNVHRCRHYLMAKSPHTAKFEEIHHFSF